MPRCGERFAPSKLLYPIAQKDYETDPAIRSNWRALKGALEEAIMWTIFGYSAPQSDRGAVDLLHEAWGGWEKRHLEQVEMIDIKPEDELRETWSRFVHTHHYQVHADFYDSSIANHPRRTGEAYWSQYMDAQFIESNPLPRTADFADLWSWFEPLIAAEARSESETDRSSAT